MTVWPDDLTRDDSTTETSNTIFGVPLLIVSVTLALPVIPFIAYLLGPRTIDGFGMWFIGTSGWAWIGGYVLLMVLEVVIYGRKIIKHIAEKS